MQDEPQYASADGSALRIWADTAKNNFVSDLAGRPIFDEVIYVEVISPGSRGSLPVFELERIFSKEGAEHYGKLSQRTTYYDKYKEAVESFKANSSDASGMSGTPLSEWPVISRSLAASLRANKIYSVEALANLPDTALGQVGPDGRIWRDKAKAWLDATASSAGVTALAAEVAALRENDTRAAAERAELARQIETLTKERDEAIQAAGKAAGRAKPAPAPADPATLSPLSAAAPGGGLAAIV